LDFISREAALSNKDMPGRIIMKMNGLTDERLIDALYEASQEGTEIDLIVRGSCAHRPGVGGLSENIRVRSILGRFLEHSRIFYSNNNGAPEVLIGSADLMHRNLDRRVEATVRINESDVSQRLKEILDLALEDNAGAWTLASDGTWSRSHPSEEEAFRDLQAGLMQQAIRNA
jgi:polyphosphate kinase